MSPYVSACFRELTHIARLLAKISALLPFDPVPYRSPPPRMAGALTDPSVCMCIMGLRYHCTNLPRIEPFLYPGPTPMRILCECRHAAAVLSNYIRFNLKSISMKARPSRP